jgi:hypothetical protein
MARRIVETLIDDTDGTIASETVVFAIDGSSYQIDLSDPNATKIRDALAPFVAVARTVHGSATRRGRGRTGAPHARLSREKSAEIRQWAKKNKITVSERGRIAAHVVKQYEAANQEG